MNLAAGLTEWNQGQFLTNIEQAISICGQALEALDREATPIPWGIAMSTLGNAYLRRIEGTRRQNIDQAVFYYRAALTVQPPQVSPIDWIRTMNNLALALTHDLSGPRRSKLSEAIDLYGEVIQVAEFEKLPFEWATAKANLGTAYGSWDQSEKREYLEKAIDCFQEALEVQTREAVPFDWAISQAGLGKALMDRIDGDQQRNLELSIEAYRRALTIFSSEGAPLEWARALNNLGAALMSRFTGNRSDNLEEARDCFMRALTTRTREQVPLDWAETQANLGSLYAQRLCGDRSQNLESAIAACRAALEIHTKIEFPRAWALIQTNLGEILSLRILGDPLDNIERAGEACRNALGVLSETDDPIEWAESQARLAGVLSRKASFARPSDLYEAIEAYRKALKVGEVEPRLRSMVAVNLSNYLVKLVQLGYAPAEQGQAFVQEGVQLLKQALAAEPRSHNPVRWALNKVSLGDALTLLNAEEGPENRRQAIVCFLDALELFRSGSLPWCQGRAAARLAEIHLEDQDWQLALDSFSLVEAGFHTLFQASILRESRERELAEFPQLFEEAAYAAVRSGKDREALEYLERGRVQVLREIYRRDFADLEGLSELAPEHFDRFQQLSKELKVLESIDLNTEYQSKIIDRGQTEALMEGIRQARTDLDGVIQKIREIEGMEDFLRPLTLEAVANFTRKSSVLYLATTSYGSLALWVHASLDQADLVGGRIDSLWSNDFRSKDLERILERLEISGRVNNAGSIVPDEVAGIWKNEFFREVGKHLQELRSKDLILIPCGKLCVLPLHAIPVPGEAPAEENLLSLLDFFDISYLPSLEFLSMLHRRQRSQPERRPHFLGLGDSEPEERPLRFARVEIHSAANLFDGESEMFFGKDTLKKHISGLHPDISYLHLACHGSFDLKEPLDSGLRLADGLLAYREILQLPLKNVRLVGLASCQSGLSDFRRVPNELLGLTASFLQAGGMAVLATLWPVADESTCLLIRRFYRLHLQGDPDSGAEPLSPSAALRRSQIWLRDLTVGDLSKLLRQLRFRSGDPLALLAPRILARISTLESSDRPFSAPYFWAPFFLMGL